MVEAYEAKTLPPKRKVIAARMVEAKHIIPHFRLAAEIELDALTGVPNELRARHPNVSLSLSNLLIKAGCHRILWIPGGQTYNGRKGKLLSIKTADISVMTAVEWGIVDTGHYPMRHPSLGVEEHSCNP
jgi:pyruvate/2-oxoglutarate dehydrogenase complex dihydrolipoamide acyltransferase (E2) component